MIFPVFLLALHCVQVLGFDPCLPGGHKTIDEPHRSVLSVPESTDHLQCDTNIVEGWYVFNGGNDSMPTSCVTEYHCGTRHPVWMQGGNPTIADGVVQRKGCVSVAQTTSKSCCDLFVDIHVKKCSSFYVYYLKPLTFCPAAYCAGNKQVCSVGGATTNSTCPDLFPKMTKFPILGKPEVKNNNSVQFSCHVQYPLGQPNVSFEVSWTVDNKPLTNPKTGAKIVTEIAGDSRTATLDASMLQGNLGKTLKCAVRSYYVNSSSIKSDILHSEGYWCGIRVTQDRILIEEGGKEKEVHFESTLPLPCHAFNTNECKLTVKLDTHKDTTVSSCKYDIKQDPQTGKYVGSFKVEATQNFVKDDHKVNEITFKPITSFNYPMWNNYTVSAVHVETKDHYHGHCNAHGDPHFRGLDYKGNYNVYVTGEMTLYECKKSTRPFQIQVKTWPCGHYHPCICALVAREGNDVIQIDMCEKRRNQHAAPEVAILSQNALEGTTIHRDRRGRKFFINFPSGARLVVSALVLRRHHEYDGLLEADLQVPPDNKHCAVGLCGLWNGNPRDDLLGGDGKHYSLHHVNDFARSWLVKRSESLFDKILPFDPSLSPSHSYCTCNNGNVDCTKTSKNVGAKNCNGKCYTVRVNRLNRFHWRRYADDDLDGEQPVDDDLQQQRVLVKRVAPLMDDASASKLCSDGLKKSTLYKRCGDSLSVNISALIEACMEDAKASGSDLFLITQMSAFDSICQNEVMKDIANYQANSQGELVPPLDVTDHVCPNQCSRRGTCHQGTCQCDSGYTSGDCSVSISEPPIIKRIRGTHQCDVRRRPCSETNFIVDNVDVEQVKCVYTSLSDHKVKMSVKAEMVSFLEVICPLPNHKVSKGFTNQVYNVTITTDDTHFSEGKIFIIYDSVCQQCNETGACTTNRDSCSIDGYCYKSGYITPHGDKACDPSRSMTSWSPTVLDMYTAVSTGCQCQHNPSSFDCACCRNGGCQCLKDNSHRCSDCSRVATCGR